MSHVLKDPKDVFTHTTNGVVLPGTALITDTTVQTSLASYTSADKIITYSCFIQAEASHAFVGTMTVEWSNSTKEEIGAGTDKWATYDALTVPIPAVNLGTGASVLFGIELVDFGFQRVRLKFTPASGQGTVYAHVVLA